MAIRRKRGKVNDGLIARFDFVAFSVYRIAGADDDGRVAPRQHVKPTDNTPAMQVDAVAVARDLPGLGAHPQRRAARL